MVSRVANNPVSIPSGVEVKLQAQDVTVKGSKGQLTWAIHPKVKVTQEGGALQFMPSDESLESNAQAGTTRSLLNNMIIGVNEGFERKLELVGVGYRAKAQGKTLNLTVGKSHPVNIEMPEGVTVETPAATEIVLKSANKQLLGQVAANIRSERPPEPYKGKGIRYSGEHIVRKEGKKK